MAGVNFAILVGNLGRDPEVRHTQTGGRLATFSMATSETWKDKATGERKERTEWHNIVIFAEGLVGVAEKYLKKGSKVFVRGQIRTRKWMAQDGTDRWTTEIVLQGPDAQIVMLDGKSGANSGQRPPTPTPGDYDREATGSQGSDSDASGAVADLDDEMPF